VRHFVILKKGFDTRIWQCS